jgi:hypothetical protein
MVHPVKSILATNLAAWWTRLSFKEKLFLIILGFLAAIAIPLSFSATSKTNRTQAGAQNYYPSTVKNNPPSISAQELHCRVNEPCTATIKAVDPDITDELSMEVDFLPSGFLLTRCDHKTTITTNLGLTCSLEGKIDRKITYKLLATVTDTAGNQARAVIGLNFR